MDIGKQQRVIIVEPEQEPVLDPVADLEPLTESEAAALAAAWPLPLDYDPEPVS